MATVTDIGTLLTQSPGICGGRLRIAGTGVSVLRIAGWYKMGRSPEEIASQYGHLTMVQVHAAITYYHANQEAIEAEIAAEQALYDRLSQEQAALRAQAKKEGWIDRITGTFKDDPDFDEILRLGREIRQADRPSSEDR